MNIEFPGLRNRRVAASEETLSTADNPRTRDDPEATRNYIYHSSSRALMGGAVGARRYDREASEIRAIILHQTGGVRNSAGNRFVGGTYLQSSRPYNGSRVIFTPGELSRNPVPNRSQDSRRASDHTVDQIAAHFVILVDGTVFYTHDVQFLIASAGGRLGIDIEFAGNFDRNHRLPVRAIRSARQFIDALKQQIPTITHIHPHGQVQRQDKQGRCGATTGNPCDKWTSCPGPDIWVNVGMWSVRTRGLICDPPLPRSVSGYGNNGIAPAQQDRDYLQETSHVWWTGFNVPPPPD